jgi:uncharacterized membrane protein
MKVTKRKIAVVFIIWMMLPLFFYFLVTDHTVYEIIFHLATNIALFTLLFFIQKIAAGNENRATGVNYWIVGAIYLIFLACFWVHLSLIVDPFIDSDSRLIQKIIHAGFNYSSQLNCTFFMLMSNIMACVLIVYMLFKLVQLNTFWKSETEKSTTTLKMLLMASIYIFGALSLLALLRHNQFMSKAWDLAIFAQLIENFKNGIYFEANVRGVANIFSDHFNPIIYVFSPLLYIWNDPSRLLLVIQAFFLTIGVIPVYLLAKQKLDSLRAARLVGIAYLILPVLQYLTLADFHPVVISIPLMLFAWYFMEIRRFGWMYFFIALCLMCDEQMWIVIGAMGLFIAIFRKDRIRGIALTVIGWGGFIALILWFFPSFREGQDYFYIHRYAYLGNSLREIAGNLIVHPGLWLPRLFSARVFVFAFLMLLPVGFLPLFKPKYLLILLPTFFYNALSIEPLQMTVFAQYTAPYIPFLMISAIYGLKVVGDRVNPLSGEKQNTYLALGTAVACTTILANIYFSPTYFSKAVNEVFVRPNFMEEFNCEGAIMRLTESYKNGLTISAGSKFAPHLIQRELHLFPTYKQANLIIFDPDDYTNKSDLLYINNLLENQDYITTDYKKSEYESPHLQNSLPPIILSKKPGTPGEGDINPDDVESFPQQYFGAVVKYKKYSPFLLYGGKPEFEIYRFDNDGLSPDQLKANLRDYLSRKSELSSWNDSDEIYIIPMPYDYPNTLDEYFTELYVSTFNMRLYEENQGISE